MRRVEQPVTLDQARERLRAYRDKNGYGPHKAAFLADAIWPGTKWVRSQGAGAAAVRVIKKLGCKWVCEGVGYRRDWGWMLSNLGI